MQQLWGAHAPRVLISAPRRNSLFRRSSAMAGRHRQHARRVRSPDPEMKINKETRQLSKELLRASFVDGQLDSRRVSSLVKSLIEKKPRHFIQVLEAYQRLLRLEVEKRTAVIETATELSPDAGHEMVNNLKR